MGWLETQIAPEGFQDMREIMLSGWNTDKKKTLVQRRGRGALPNGDWIACVAWVMYGMFLKTSASSGVLMTPWRLSPSSASGLSSPLASRLIQESALQDLVEVEPFFKFLRLIR